MQANERTFRPDTKARNATSDTQGNYINSSSQKLDSFLIRFVL